LISQDNISAATPAGTEILPTGATFKVWAYRATAVYLNGTFNGSVYAARTGDRLLSRDTAGYWTGFQAGARDGDPYRFWVEGTGGIGFKRDPYARELSPAGFPDSASILRSAGGFPWHDMGFRTPDFSDMIIYQLHIGVFNITRPNVSSNFLDVIAKVPYLVALGINVLQPLPIDEQENHPSMGYGGADLFSPDFPYVAADADLPGYLATINAMLDAKGVTRLQIEHIRSAPGQLKALIDLCHVHGIAVVLDVVYNHAGGFSVNNVLDDNCLYYMDRVPNAGDNNDSLYFTDKDRGTGGLAFAMWNADVCHYLVDNAQYFIKEFHVDGLRYDEVSTLLSTNQGNGWQFCRDLTTQLRNLQNRILQNAEFWPGRFDDIPSTAQPIIAPASAGGAGFDVVQHDYLRRTLRDAIGAASGGASASISLTGIADALYPPGFDHAWRAVTCIENHDLVLAGRDPRIPALANRNEPHGWYARSRTRFANAILLTAPGIPQLFMGQEFLEKNAWDVQPNGPNLLSWGDLNSGSDRAMTDHLRFMQDLIHLRQNEPALRGDSVNAFYKHDIDRVIAFHRWLEGAGQDLVVVGTLRESTWYDYNLGFPAAGFWAEVFNSDVYDNWANPIVAGNGTGVHANGGPMHGLPASASVIIPANGVVVFARV
jgi:1,4-alpha-glucan branching enzyme